jgi:hypothetical protein
MLLSPSNEHSKMDSLAFFDDFSDFSIQKALAIMYPHDKRQEFYRKNCYGPQKASLLMGSST